MSRVNESPSSELFTVEDEKEVSEAVAVNVVGTVSRPMLSTYMVLELLRGYKAEKNTRKDFEIIRMADLSNN
jgi:hypothetical protein